jgi:predicted O-methyltransferase YrrM
MGFRSIATDAIESYLTETLAKETPVQRRLREETRKLPLGVMQIGPDQAAFLALLVRLLGARRTLEVGTFTGYSALAVASVLPADGKLIACDVSEEWTQIARRYWRDAGVADRIELHLRPAIETLDALVREGQTGRFDFAFIDADKTRYDAYYERALVLIRQGGLIAIDNVLWSGAVADPKQNDSETAALKALNLKIRDDARVDAVLVSIGDGVMLARKR